MQRRWVRVGLLALAIVLVNAISRFVTWKFHLVEDNQQARLDAVLIGVLAILVMAATVWWALRHPFPRVFFDIGAAIVVGVLGCLIIGPLAGGIHPFSESVGVFVAEFLLFVLVTGLFGFLAFLGLVAVGKDWKSRGLRRYEQNYSKRPHRTVKG